MANELVRAIISVEVPGVSENMRGRLFDAPFIIPADLINENNECNPTAISAADIATAINNGLDNTQYNWNDYREGLYSELMYRFLNDTIKFDRVDRATPLVDIAGAPLYENDIVDTNSDDCYSLIVKKLEDGTYGGVDEDGRLVRDVDFATFELTPFFEESGWAD